jgi:TnpA family transposase
LIPDARWPHLRGEFCAQAQVPVNGAERLRQRQATLTNCLIALDQTLPGNTQVRIENGSAVLTPLKAEELPASVNQLRQVVTERLPRIDLTDLVLEVDSWFHFTQHFEHAGGSEPRTPDLQAYLYAAVLAQGCNFGLTTMAHIADFSYWRLAWCTNWYLRDETLRPAIVALVNFQHRQRLSKYWGGGTLSSSDGQRFPVAVRNRHARALPRYYGYGKGLTMLSWTSDQHTQYGSKVVPSTVRDSTYVLDAILDNETDLPIIEHATDTAGVTDIIFALFDLLNLQFSPRIRDLGDQRLYRMERTPQAPTLEPLLKGTINQKLIVEHWDALLRIAASLKFGWVPASLLIARMQAAPRENAVTRALQEYGRLIRTIFILRYLESEPYRRKIEVQLNKGEALHAVRQLLFFAHEGQLRKRQAEAQADQAHCLTLLADTVIAWNTVYMTAVLEQLEREGYPVNESDLEHLSPARYEHINPYGKYRFNMEEELNRTALRPLRSTKAVSD